MSGEVFQHNFRIVAGSATMGAALSAGSLPASGSFVDLTGVTTVVVLCHLGAIAASDAPVLEPQYATAVNGTLTQIDSTLIHTGADTDDNEWVVWTIQVDSLPTDGHFLAVAISGTIVTTTADINFLLCDTRVPVTQATAVLPAASQYYWNG